MTPEEYRDQAQRILHTRNLKQWQDQDLRHSIRLVEKRGRVLATDEYYLEIVGIPCTGPRIMHRRKPQQGSLF